MTPEPLLHQSTSAASGSVGYSADQKSAPRRVNDRGHGTEGVTSMQSKRTAQRHHEELTLRMLGQDVTFWRSQWEYLLDDLRPDTDLARRIAELIGGEVPA